MESMVREYPPLATIFQKGEPGEAAYILTEGEIEIIVETGDQRSVISVLTPVSVFGEMALILPDQKRTATAVARSTAKVAEICRADFLEFLERSPRLINAVLHALVDRLQKTTQRVARLPDLFMGTCEILSLISCFSHRQIDYQGTVDSLARAFQVSTVEIESTMAFLETVGMIDRKRYANQGQFDILKFQNFLEHARAIHQSFLKMGMIPK